ncbi:hypothetical protein BDY24DRAFT_391081 [Mrakia frigida]|uniref:uncharacterized protein n=1 Tax=Mrakia frigida TaxID=29902 RepID=UPI003FCC2103
MIPPPPWLAHFQRGIDALRARSFNEAFSSFDEAVNIGGPDLAVFPSRADVLDRLRVLEGAVNHRSSEARRSVTNSEDDASRLFQTLSNLPEYIQTAIITPPTQTTTSLEDLLLQSQARIASLLSTRPLIDYLPAELLTSIGRYVVFPGNSYQMETSDPAFKLVAVSRRWRSIFLQDRSLWGFLSVVGGSPRQLLKLEQFAAKGPLRCLRISPSWNSEDHGLRSLYGALEGKTSSLEEFDATTRHPLDWDTLWSLITHPTRPSKLQTLSIALEMYSQLGSYLPQLQLPTTVLPHLTSLSLRSVPVQHSSSLFPLFSLLPNLRSLSLSTTRNMHLILPSIDGTDRLELPSLLSLEVHDVGSDLPPELFFLVTPLLTTLTIIDADNFIQPLFLSSHPPLNYPNLQHLFIENGSSEIDTSRLIENLRHLPSNLISLSLRWFHDLTEEIISLLTIREEEGGSTVLFPNLTSLDLTYSGTPWVDEMKAMILSRKGEGKCELKSFTVPIEELSEEMETWLKENVEKNGTIGEGGWLG